MKDWAEARFSPARRLSVRPKNGTVSEFDYLLVSPRPRALRKPGRRQHQSVLVAVAQLGTRDHAHGPRAILVSARRSHQD